ncbi:MAG: methyltransferase [Solirubrobacteraceae bacterium]
MQFAAMLLQLEGQLVSLAEALAAVGVDAVLLNGDEVRDALANGFACSFAAQLEVPLPQIPRAMGAIEAHGWWPAPKLGGLLGYMHSGVVVRLMPRRPAFWPATRGARASAGETVTGRLGFSEPPEKAALHRKPAPPVPQAFGPPGRPPGQVPRGDRIRAAARLGSLALTILDTLLLRGRELDFDGAPILYGPGVFRVEGATARHAVAIAQRLPTEPGVRVVEVGTGSGAVALAVARRRPDSEVLAIDVSLRALGWAERNRRRLAVGNVRLARGSLLAPVPPSWRGQVVAIAANLPNSPPVRELEVHGSYGWPVGTATGPGADGLGLVRALARDAREVLAPGGHLHLQYQVWHAPAIVEILEQLGYRVAADAPDQSHAGTELVASWPG